MTVILVDPRRPSLVPVEAIELLGGEVQYTEEMPVKVPWSLPAARSAHTGEDAPVLLSSDAEHPAVSRRLAAGERLISAPGHAARGATGGCRRDDGQAAHRGALGKRADSRLAAAVSCWRRPTSCSMRSTAAIPTRCATSSATFCCRCSFTRASPRTRLNIRSPSTTSPMRCCASWATGLRESLPAIRFRWTSSWLSGRSAKLWRSRANSVMDDVPTGQPALALAHKVVQRVTRAGLPLDLIPTNITSITVTADVDAENALRTAILEFMDTVRAVEKAVAADRRVADAPAELDVAAVGTITEDEWRACWPSAETASADEAPADDPGDQLDSVSISRLPYIANHGRPAANCKGCARNAPGCGL